MIERIVTDNGACYRSKVFAEAVLPARQQRITPYTPPPTFSGLVVQKATYT